MLWSFRTLDSGQCPETQYFQLNIVGSSFSTFLPRYTNTEYLCYTDGLKHKYCTSTFFNFKLLCALDCHICFAQILLSPDNHDDEEND